MNPTRSSTCANTFVPVITDARPFSRTMRRATAGPKKSQIVSIPRSTALAAMPGAGSTPCTRISCFWNASSRTPTLLPMSTTSSLAETPSCAATERANRAQCSRPACVVEDSYG